MIRLFRIFRVGILCSSSWIRPRGQIQPQMVRPRMTPNSARMPITYQGAVCPAAFSAFCREPRGQLAMAPGQE